MKNHRISLNKYCPCTQPDCPILGNCVLCVQNHLEHKRHVPECMQDLLRPAVQALADKMEFQTDDRRPSADSWAEFDSKGFLKRTLAKHRRKIEKGTKG